MLLHDQIRGRLGTDAADNVADYFERLARDLRTTADWQRDINRRQAKATEQIALAHALPAAVQDDIDGGEPTTQAIIKAAQHHSLPVYQLAAFWKQYQLQQARSRREYRDTKIVQLVKRKWSNAAVARELARLGYVIHPSTVTRVWKRHLGLRDR